MPLGPRDEATDRSCRPVYSMLLPSLLTLAEMTTIDRNIATRNDDCDCATHTDAQPLSLRELMIFDLFYNQFTQIIDSIEFAGVTIFRTIPTDYDLPA
jgi:hypothetical protein